MNFIAAQRQRVKGLKGEIIAVYLAYRDPRTPWYAKVFLAAVIGYFISPVDLIPDFIPVVGYLDDLIIVPGGIYLAIKMIPRGVMEECREKAKVTQINSRAKWVIAGIIIALWLLVIGVLVRFIWLTFS